MYHIPNIASAILVLSLLTGISAHAESKTRGNFTNVCIDPPEPVKITIFNKPQMLKAPEDEDHGPIVDRKYQMLCKFLPDETDKETLYLLGHIEGIVEYADGRKAVGAIEESGALGIADMLLWDSGPIETSVCSQIGIRINNSVKLPTEADPVCNVSTEAEFELNLKSSDDYGVLKNFSTLKSHAFIGTDFFNYEYDNYYDGSLILEDFRQQLISEGLDPNSFSASSIKYHPAPTFRIDGIEYNGEIYQYFVTKLKYGLYGMIYVEGGLGKNCTMMTIGERPTTPKGSATLTHIGKTGKYMDAWRITSNLETSQYGVEFYISRDDTYYLPYPTDDEAKAAAREAGYDVP